MNKLSLALTSGFLYALTLSNLYAQSAANNNVAVTKEEQDKKAAATHGAELEKNSACKNIINECKKLGFIAGQFKDGNGLWRGCVASVLEGKQVMQKGKVVKVTASAADIATCKEFSDKAKAKHGKSSATK